VNKSAATQIASKLTYINRICCACFRPFSWW